MFFLLFLTLLSSETNHNTATNTREEIIRKENPIERILKMKIPIKTSFISQKLLTNTVYGFSDEKITIKECVFDSLTTDSSGAGVFCCDMYVEITINSTGFRQCSAKQQGGAISFEGSSLKLFKCCFLGCVSSKKGQAFISMSDIDMNKPVLNIVDSTTFDQCGTEINPGFGSVAALQNADQSQIFVNYTRNHVKDIGACMCVGHNVRSKIMFLSVSNCQGLNVFWFHKFNENDQITQLNVLSNNLAVGKNEFFSSIFVLEDSKASLMGVTFIGNVVRHYIIQGKVVLSQCVFDCKFDEDLLSSNCNISIDHNCVFGERNAKKRPLPYIVTWSCWGFGKPSPTPQAQMNAVPLDTQSEISGPVCMLVLCIIGPITGFSSYYFITKQEEEKEKRRQPSMQQAPQLQSLENVENE